MCLNLKMSESTKTEEISAQFFFLSEDGSRTLEVGYFPGICDMKYEDLRQKALELFPGLKSFTHFNIYWQQIKRSMNILELNEVGDTIYNQKVKTCNILINSDSGMNSAKDEVTKKIGLYEKIIKLYVQPDVSYCLCNVKKELVGQLSLLNCNNVTINDIRRFKCYRDVKLQDIVVKAAELFPSLKDYSILEILRHDDLTVISSETEMAAAINQMEENRVFKFCARPFTGCDFCDEEKEFSGLVSLYHSSTVKNKVEQPMTTFYCRRQKITHNSFLETISNHYSAPTSLFWRDDSDLIKIKSDWELHHAFSEMQDESVAKFYIG